MEPWNVGVEGDLTLELINSNATTIRVEAGPGTGKTYGVVRRVIRILHPQGLAVPGAQVLIVAFNRVIAKDLAEAVQTALDPASDGRPVIKTVHALCLQALSTSVRLLLPHEREAMLYDVLHTHPQLSEKFERQQHAETALSLHEARLEDHPDLWQGVQRWLTQHEAALISDLPGLLLDKLHAGDYDGTAYQHVIVDEFQDLTPGEQLLFMKLRSPGGSLVALGDPRQSIYRFRGNDPEGLKKLEELDRDATVNDIPMDECRRCPEPMVRAANRLMSLYPPPMKSANIDPANIHVVTWNTPDAEAKGLAPHILNNLKAHPPGPDCRHLVMVTRKRFGYRLREEIKALDAGISFDLSFTESLLESWPVREAFLFFSLVVAPDAPTWRAWLGYQTPNDDDSAFKAPKRNAPAYLRFLQTYDDSITAEAVEALAAEPRNANRGQGGSNLWDRAARFIELRKAHQIQQHDSAQAVIEQILNTDAWVVNASETVKLDFSLLRSKTLELADELTERAQAKDRDVVLTEVAQQLRYMIGTREPFESNYAHDLQITTLWGSKGITAHHVYLIGLCGEALPGEPRPDYPGTHEQYQEEQRRLFYVSITRSKATLVLSRPKKVSLADAKQLRLVVTEKDRWHAYLKMCPFVRDIARELPAAVAGETWQGCVA